MLAEKTHIFECLPANWGTHLLPHVSALPVASQDMLMAMEEIQESM